MLLEGKEAIADFLKASEIVRGQDLPLNDREIDLDLVEPDSMNGRVHQTSVRAGTSSLSGGRK